MSLQKKISHITIREMNLDDLLTVEDLDKRCFSQPWPAGSFLHELRSDSYSLCLVAEDTSDESNPKVIGSIVVWLIVDEAHIATLAIDPEYRNLGIARRLLATALLQASEMGAIKSLLEVRSGNLTALRLYFGFGYEVVGLRPGYYQDNHEDALLLTLNNIDQQQLNRINSMKLPSKGMK